MSQTASYSTTDQLPLFASAGSLPARCIPQVHAIWALLRHRPPVSKEDKIAQPVLVKAGQADGTEPNIDKTRQTSRHHGQTRPSTHTSNNCRPGKRPEAHGENRVPSPVPTLPRRPKETRRVPLETCFEPRTAHSTRRPPAPSGESLSQEQCPNPSSRETNVREVTERATKNQISGAFPETTSQRVRRVWRKEAIRNQDFCRVTFPDLFPDAADGTSFFLSSDSSLDDSTTRKKSTDCRTHSLIASLRKTKREASAGETWRQESRPNRKEHRTRHKKSPSSRKAREKHSRENRRKAKQRSTSIPKNGLLQIKVGATPTPSPLSRISLLLGSTELREPTLNRVARRPKAVASSPKLTKPTSASTTKSFLTTVAADPPVVTSLGSRQNEVERFSPDAGVIEEKRVPGKPVTLWGEEDTLKHRGAVEVKGANTTSTGEQTRSIGVKEWIPAPESPPKQQMSPSVKSFACADAFSETKTSCRNGQEGIPEESHAHSPLSDSTEDSKKTSAWVEEESTFSPPWRHTPHNSFGPTVLKVIPEKQHECEQSLAPAGRKESLLKQKTDTGETQMCACRSQHRRSRSLSACHHPSVKNHHEPRTTRPATLSCSHCSTFSSDKGISMRKGSPQMHTWSTEMYTTEAKVPFVGMNERPNERATDAPANGKISALPGQLRHSPGATHRGSVDIVDSCGANATSHSRTSRKPLHDEVTEELEVLRPGAGLPAPGKSVQETARREGEGRPGGDATAVASRSPRRSKDQTREPPSGQRRRGDVREQEKARRLCHRAPPAASSSWDRTPENVAPHGGPRHHEETEGSASGAARHCCRRSSSWEREAEKKKEKRSLSTGRTVKGVSKEQKAHLHYPEGRARAARRTQAAVTVMREGTTLERWTGRRSRILEEKPHGPQTLQGARCAGLNKTHTGDLRRNNRRTAAKLRKESEVSTAEEEESRSRNTDGKSRERQHQHSVENQHVTGDSCDRKERTKQTRRSCSYPTPGQEGVIQVTAKQLKKPGVISRLHIAEDRKTPYCHSGASFENDSTYSPAVEVSHKHPLRTNIPLCFTSKLPRIEHRKRQWQERGEREIENTPRRSWYTRRANRDVPEAPPGEAEPPCRSTDRAVFLSRPGVESPVGNRDRETTDQCAQLEPISREKMELSQRAENESSRFEESRRAGNRMQEIRQAAFTPANGGRSAATKEHTGIDASQMLRPQPTSGRKVDVEQNVLAAQLLAQAQESLLLICRLYNSSFNMMCRPPQSQTHDVPLTAEGENCRESPTNFSSQMFTPDTMRSSTWAERAENKAVQTNPTGNSKSHDTGSPAIERIRHTHYDAGSCNHRRKRKSGAGFQGKNSSDETVTDREKSRIVRNSALRFLGEPGQQGSLSWPYHPEQQSSLRPQPGSSPRTAKGPGEYQQHQRRNDDAPSLPNLTFEGEDMPPERSPQQKRSPTTSAVPPCSSLEGLKALMMPTNSPTSEWRLASHSVKEVNISPCHPFRYVPPFDSHDRRHNHQQTPVENIQDFTALHVDKNRQLPMRRENENQGCSRTGERRTSRSPSCVSHNHVYGRPQTQHIQQRHDARKTLLRTDQRCEQQALEARNLRECTYNTVGVNPGALPGEHPHLWPLDNARSKKDNVWRAPELHRCCRSGKDGKTTEDTNEEQLRQKGERQERASQDSASCWAADGTDERSTTVATEAACCPDLDSRVHVQFPVEYRTTDGAAAGVNQRTEAEGVRRKGGSPKGSPFCSEERGPVERAEKEKRERCQNARESERFHGPSTTSDRKGVRDNMGAVQERVEERGGKIKVSSTPLLPREIDQIEWQKEHARLLAQRRALEAELEQLETEHASLVRDRQLSFEEQERQLRYMKLSCPFPFPSSLPPHQGCYSKVPCFSDQNKTHASPSCTLSNSGKHTAAAALNALSSLSSPLVGRDLFCCASVRRHAQISPVYHPQSRSSTLPSVPQSRLPLFHVQTPAQTDRQRSFGNTAGASTGYMQSGVKKEAQTTTESPGRPVNEDSPPPLPDLAGSVAGRPPVSAQRRQIRSFVIQSPGRDEEQESQKDSGGEKHSNRGNEACSGGPTAEHEATVKRGSPTLLSSTPPQQHLLLGKQLRPPTTHDPHSGCSRPSARKSPSSNQLTEYGAASEERHSAPFVSPSLDFYPRREPSSSLRQHSLRWNSSCLSPVPLFPPPFPSSHVHEPSGLLPFDDSSAPCCTSHRRPLSSKRAFQGTSSFCRLSLSLRDWRHPPAEAGSRETKSNLVPCPFSSHSGFQGQESFFLPTYPEYRTFSVSPSDQGMPKILPVNVPVPFGVFPRTLFSRQSPSSSCLDSLSPSLPCKALSTPSRTQTNGASPLRPAPENQSPGSPPPPVADSRTSSRQRTENNSLMMMHSSKPSADCTNAAATKELLSGIRSPSLSPPTLDSHGCAAAPYVYPTLSCFLRSPHILSSFCSPKATEQPGSQQRSRSWMPKSPGHRPCSPPFSTQAISPCALPETPSLLKSKSGQNLNGINNEKREEEEGVDKQAEGMGPTEDKSTNVRSMFPDAVEARKPYRQRSPRTATSKHLPWSAGILTPCTISDQATQSSWSSCPPSHLSSSPDAGQILPFLSSYRGTVSSAFSSPFDEGSTSAQMKPHEGPRWKRETMIELPPPGMPRLRGGTPRCSSTEISSPRSRLMRQERATEEKETDEREGNLTPGHPSELGEAKADSQKKSPYDEVCLAPAPLENRGEEQRPLGHFLVSPDERRDCAQRPFLHLDSGTLILSSRRPHPPAKLPPSLRKTAAALATSILRAQTP